MQMLAAKGHDITCLRSKNVAEFQQGAPPVMDFVFTVCDRAANEECAVWPGQPLSGHWGMPDPASVIGSEAERLLAFQQTYGALRNRIAAFAALPVAQCDRRSLQTQVDAIGRTTETQE